MALLVSQTYAGVYLNAADLAPLGRRRNAVIHAVALEEVGQEKRQLLVLDLVSPAGKGWQKRVPLNKTNSTQLAAAFGDDASGWPGRTIEIWSENVMFQGKLLPGVKVMPAAAQPRAAQPAAQPVVPPPAPPIASNPNTPPGAAPPVALDDRDEEIPY